MRPAVGFEAAVVLSDFPVATYVSASYGQVVSWPSR